MTDDWFTTEPGPYPRRANDADTLYGEGWFAERASDGCVLSWDGGEIAIKMLKVTISEEEFERLRTNPEAFTELQFKYDPYR